MSTELPADVAEALRAELTAYADRTRDQGTAQRARYAIPHVLGEVPCDDAVLVSAYGTLLSVSAVGAPGDESTPLARGRRHLERLCRRLQPQAARVAAVLRPTYPRHEDDHEGRAVAREIAAGRGDEWQDRR